jgi:acyl-CoA reductase-like NAD-dependent aldehyde dehydrogenase
LERKIYVVDALHDVFAERFTSRVAAMHAGDGFDERSGVVPLIDANAIQRSAGASGTPSRTAAVS